MIQKGFMILVKKNKNKNKKQDLQLLFIMCVKLCIKVIQMKVWKEVYDFVGWFVVLGGLIRCEFFFGFENV